MFRSLSTKLLLAVLAAVILPFAGFAVFLEHQIADRMVRDFVRQSLLGLAGDLAKEIDAMLLERREDLLLWAGEPIAAWALEDAPSTRAGARTAFGAKDVLAADQDSGEAARNETFLPAAVRSLNRYVSVKPQFDLLLLITAEGRLAAVNGRTPARAPQTEEFLERLYRTDFERENWFTTALSGSFALVNHHPSKLMHPEGVGEHPVPTDFHLGLAAPVYAYLDPERVVGVLYGLVNWESFQARTEAPLIKDAFRGLVSGGEVPSPYAWIWDQDGDTILAHNNTDLYYSKVSGPRIGLPSMVEDVRGRRAAMYRDYVFEGLAKTAAFHRTRAPDQNGFDWVVGVGINDSDIVAASRDQRRLLLRGTLVVLLTVLLWGMIIARRTVRPIEELERHTERVAAGDLTSRVVIDRSDELGRLGSAMNRMTAELASQREKLVRAEKDAAWREMARQVAHDLKNPLTPIQLSLDLYERARREGSPQAEEILSRTLELVRRQVDSLRRVANDFHEFTGGPPPQPEHLELEELLGKVFDLHRAWAQEQGIELVLDGAAAPVFVDPSKLERVLTNLVANAFHAMPDGGRLEARLERIAQRARLTLTDTGAGLEETTKRRLFEPYFTTKSHGTGLGLAIAARIIDEMGGSIALESEGPGRGAVATLELPIASDSNHIRANGVEP